jgi:dolichol-phosphate mannosyltransferase
LIPCLSIIVPAFNEGSQIVNALDRILEAVTRPCEVLVVFDSLDDTTAPFAAEYAQRDPRVRAILNTDGRGPARALKYGINAALAETIVVTMADGSDDVSQIDNLAALIEQGSVLAAASRYAAGGRQEGGPLLKKILSRAAGLSLHWLAGIPIHDPTNSYKAYSKSFVQAAGIQSDAGFEIGLELTVKAKRLGMPMAEIPTVWNDRSEGKSNFQVTRWLPRYIRWYVLAFGPRSRPARSDDSLTQQSR